jgi:hypothetical protein
MILTLALKPRAAFACVAEWTNLGLKLHWSSMSWDGCHSLLMEIACPAHLSTLTTQVNTTTIHCMFSAAINPKTSFQALDQGMRLLYRDYLYSCSSVHDLVWYKYHMFQHGDGFQESFDLEQFLSMQNSKYLFGPWYLKYNRSNNY